MMKRDLNLLIILLYLLVSAQTTFAQVSDAKMPYASDKPVSEPTVFAPGIISTGDYEGAQEFSPDGKTLYYLKLTPDFNFWTLVFSRFENGAWTHPRVAPFSGRYSDADPFITLDGKRLFFVSRRPVDPKISPNAANALDIYVMEKNASGAWSEPQNLGKPVNSEASEFFPTLTMDGTLYFGSRRAGGKGGVDLYRARFVNGKFQEPENLGDAINTQFDEYEPFIAPDESYLLFMADGRPDGLGGFDLYVSYNENGKWTKAENLGALVNTAANELSPKRTRDGKYFFWTSSRSAIDQPKEKAWTIEELTQAVRAPQNGLGDIYYIDADRLKLKK
jgi:Tol biopolymer transport system component